MLPQPMATTLMILGLICPAGMATGGCGWKPGAGQSGSAPSPDVCADSAGPSGTTVRQAVAAVPVVATGATWIEAARGHTRDCRMYWVKLVPSGATAASPEQLLFFDHDTALGTPTPNPKPYTTVLSSGEGTVTVQYQWRVGDEPDCCPIGIGTTRYGIGADGGLQALDPVPNR